MVSPVGNRRLSAFPRRLAVQVCSSLATARVGRVDEVQTWVSPRTADEAPPVVDRPTGTFPRFETQHAKRRGAIDDTIERRDVLRRASLAAGAAAALAAAPALGQGSPTPGPKPATYEIKPLALDPTNVKGLSEKILLSHHDNNDTGAVKRLNAIKAQLAELDFAKTRSSW